MVIEVVMLIINILLGHVVGDRAIGITFVAVAEHAATGRP
jgi:hypothetical protein